MNSDETLANYDKFIRSVPPFGTVMGLDGISALLRELDNFHLLLKVIHIAGTNGKGSSAKMLSSVYYAAGISVGVYTSPYIFDYRECITLNETMISVDKMNAATAKIQHAYEQLVKKHLPLPTHYECLTAIAFMAMYLEKVELCVIEVLMGGMNDATNVITTPLASLITSISFDHMEYLGSTLSSIAQHKAGIIKKNCPVVLNQNPPEVIDQLTDIAKLLNAPVILSYLENAAFPIEYTKSMKLQGEHQIINLQGVLCILKLLNSKYKVSDSNIMDGLSVVVHPCRLEILYYKDKMFLLDGSHNVEGITALVNYIATHYSNKHIVFILGMLKDKDIAAVLNLVYPLATQVILTLPENARGLNPTDFYALLNSHQQRITLISQSIPEAFELTRHVISHEGINSTLFVTCGSLYVSFPMRRHILQNL